MPLSSAAAVMNSSPASASLPLGTLPFPPRGHTMSVCVCPGGVRPPPSTQPKEYLPLPSVTEFMSTTHASTASLPLTLPFLQHIKLCGGYVCRVGVRAPSSYPSITLTFAALRFGGHVSRTPPPHCCHRRRYNFHPLLAHVEYLLMLRMCASCLRAAAICSTTCRGSTGTPTPVV